MWNSYTVRHVWLLYHSRGSWVLLFPLIKVSETYYSAISASYILLAEAGCTTRNNIIFLSQHKKKKRYKFAGRPAWQKCFLDARVSRQHNGYDAYRENPAGPLHNEKERTLLLTLYIGSDGGNWGYRLSMEPVLGLISDALFVWGLGTF